MSTQKQEQDTLTCMLGVVPLSTRALEPTGGLHCQHHPNAEQQPAKHGSKNEFRFLKCHVFSELSRRVELGFFCLRGGFKAGTRVCL